MEDASGLAAHAARAKRHASFVSWAYARPDPSEIDTTKKNQKTPSNPTHPSSHVPTEPFSDRLVMRLPHGVPVTVAGTVFSRASPDADWPREPFTTKPARRLNRRHRAASCLRVHAVFHHVGQRFGWFGKGVSTLSWMR